MTKAKQPAAGSPKATPRGDSVSPNAAEHLQLSVLILQADALEHDEAVRQELKRGGYVVKHQALVHLSADAARQFVLEVCNPRSAMYRPPTPLEAEVDTHTTLTSSDEHGGGDFPAPITTDEDLGSIDDADEVVEHAIHALLNGPMLVLGVEKPHAVTELLQLVGPADPAAWAESSCLRARFAKDAPIRLGLRCSTQVETAEHELAFLLAHSGSKSHGQNQAHNSSVSLRSGASPTKSGAMDLDQLLNFLFPKHLQHPNSAGRLFVFGLYGPLDSHSRLRSGERGLHVVTDRELTTMSTRIEREDILAVYGMCSLSQEEEEEVVRQVDRLLKCYPQYTPRDIETLFSPLLRDADGNMNFHDMQRAVMKERLRRVVCMKERLHPALGVLVRNQFSRTLTRLTATKGGSLVNGAPSSFFLKDVGATDVENAALVSRLLSTRAFQICQMEDGNSPELTQNIVLGPPGSGKTTYCNGMQQFLQANRRDVAVVNMDPANEQLPYVADVDVSEMVCLENVMEELDLGPNGGLVYCMDYINVNFDWLEEKLAVLKDKYVLFDFPGQVELYTHENSVHSILHKLQKLGYRLTVVHLVDAHHCTDSSKFVSVVMLSLSSMVRLELPHINVLSKIDLMQQYGKLAFNLDFYTDVLDLRYLLDRLDEPDDAEDEDQISLEPRHTTISTSRLAERFRRMNEALVDVIEDFSLVSFLPMQIQDPSTLQKVVAAIDKANGFVFTGVDFQTAVVKDYAFGDQSVPGIQEKYIDQ
ncbi:hypothetical protein JM18_003851 [Phytophthora kernoviae]|uniref:Nucleoside diphosphate kinase-like domain-containing protein n=2 Tax=Phytophthora kernoviae TaxID=325452 RepID=A0A921VAD8_9STRA|nr:hypothetical protein G195_004967 [Phytophthora kernoviae 00238/432]KAG2527432.1 hypothetical protein JM18_003851 [Phytophthora kernoviae]